MELKKQDFEKCGVLKLGVIGFIRNSSLTCLRGKQQTYQSLNMFDDISERHVLCKHCSLDSKYSCRSNISGLGALFQRIWFNLKVATFFFSSTLRPYVQMNFSKCSTIALCKTKQLPHCRGMWLHVNFVMGFSIQCANRMQGSSHLCGAKETDNLIILARFSLSPKKDQLEGDLCKSMPPTIWRKALTHWANDKMSSIWKIFNLDFPWW